MTYSVVIKKIIAIGKNIVTLWVSDNDDTKHASVTDIKPSGNGDELIVDSTKLKNR